MINFKTKILKIIPIWLIIVLAFSGTAVAAFTWISNPLRLNATVTPPPVTLNGGTWTTNPYVGVEYHQEVTYTVNRASSGSPVGYVHMVFLGAHALSDISLRGQGTGPGGSGLAYTIYDANHNNIGSNYLYLLQGYPKLTGQNTQVEYLYGVNPDPYNIVYPNAPLNFGPTGATSGVLVFDVTYNTANSITLEMQVTSSSS
jgi:hypothetical protein